MTIVEAYFKLSQLMEDIDYYKKYPTRTYLQDFIERETTIEGKVRAMLQDSLIQREVFPDWISRRWRKHRHDHTQIGEITQICVIYKARMLCPRNF